MKVKLVRDKISVMPGNRETIRPANTLPGHQLALVAKLHEEVGEVAKALTDPEEYADVLQALLDLATISGVDFEDVLTAAREKHARLGGFRRGMVLISQEP